MAYVFIIIQEEREYRMNLRRSLRDDENPFTRTSEERFIALYRFPKHLCVELIEQLKPHFKNTPRIPSHIKVLSALRFYATGNNQRGIPLEAMSRCVNEVTYALNKIAHHVIKFPSREEYTALKINFYKKHGFPGVIGLIGGTHIKITEPSPEVEHVYRCQKGGYSKNVMTVCDADLLILTSSARFGGAAHNAHVWSQSLAFQSLKNMYDCGERSFWLLGDTSYPLQPWLMTPFSNTSNDAEERYNAAHKQTRGILERCIGLLKSRFRCLNDDKVLCYEPRKAGYLIYAVMVLHNKLIRARVPITEPLANDANDLSHSSQNASQFFHVSAAARKQREKLVRETFSH